MKQSIESINQILNEYKTQRELLKQADSIDEMMTFWFMKRQEIRDRIEGNNPTDPDVFRDMFGPGSYTYSPHSKAHLYRHTYGRGVLRGLMIDRQ